MKSTAWVMHAARLLCLTLMALASPWGTAQQWKPDRPVEIIVDCTPGCSSDVMARLMQQVFKTHGYFDVPTTIQNKAGGAGALSANYLKQFEGNGHYLLIGAQGVLASHAVGRTRHTDRSPLAMLYIDHIGVAVRADSPIRSGRDLIERLRKDPGAHSFGLWGIGNTHHLAIVVALKMAGVDVRKMRNVIFTSGPQARTALLGGHVDLAPASLGALAPDLQSGALRVLAVASDMRQPAPYADVPTWRELGAATSMYLWRAMFGAHGITPAKTAYWESAFQRLTEAPEWRNEVLKRGSVPQFMGAKSLKKRMDEEYPLVAALLSDLQLAKK